jgi:ankyrin repeat protein
MKRCGGCQKELPTADFSNKQLKRKGKRSCKACVSPLDERVPMQEFVAALVSNDHVVVRNLLESESVDLGQLDFVTLTNTLLFALWMGLERSVCQSILDAKASANLVVSNAYSPLLIAIKTGHMSTVELLLSAQADPNQVCKDPENGKYYTALTCAIEMQGTHKVQISTIKMLMVVADVNIPASRSPLLVASQYAESELVKLLLFEKGAHVGAQQSLLIAAGAGHLHVAKHLIAANVDVNHADDIQGPCHMLTLASEQVL